MAPIGIFTVLRNAVSVLFRNFGVALFIATFNGGLGAILADLATKWVYYYVHPVDKQAQLLTTQLTQLAVITTWGCTVGAWAAAASIYLWVQHVKQRPVSLYEAVNFGLNRLARILPAHAKAFFIVQLGMIVIVPGILFGLQYAFVDGIAALDEQEKNPLNRSRRLTSGRRGTLFRTFACFLPWWIPYQFALVWVLQGRGPGWQFAGGLMDSFVLILLDLCMVQFYLDLFRKPAPAPAAA